MNIDLDGVSIELHRKKIKNINLRINADGVVKLSAPAKCPIGYIEQYLLEKKAWILFHQARLVGRNAATVQVFEQGASYAFQGQVYQLHIHEYSAVARVVLDAPYIHCFVKATATAALIKAMLLAWQRQEMQALLPALIQKWEPIIGVQVNEWGVKVMKTRWGSCQTQAKRIWLNLNLMQKPPICLEYVLVHELVHLLEASHNKRFYAFMTQFMPQWQSYKKQLAS